MTHQEIEIRLKELEKRIKTLEEQEPFMNKPCVAQNEEAVEIDFFQTKKTVGKLISIEVLDKIKAEIMDKSYLSYDDNPRRIIDESWVLEIIDKYKAETEQVGNPDRVVER